MDEINIEAIGTYGISKGRLSVKPFLVRNLFLISFLEFTIAFSKQGTKSGFQREASEVSGRERERENHHFGTIQFGQIEQLNRSKILGRQFVREFFSPGKRFLKKQVIRRI